MEYEHKTQAEVRHAFWSSHKQFRRIPGRSHNQYDADTRCAFVDFVDYLERSGQISQKLAENVTL